MQDWIHWHQLQHLLQLHADSHLGRRQPYLPVERAFYLSIYILLLDVNMRCKYVHIL